MPQREARWGRSCSESHLLPVSSHSPRRGGAGQGRDYGPLSLGNTVSVERPHIWPWPEPLEEGMVTHSSNVAWRIPWTEEPGRIRSVAQNRDTTEAT